MTYWDGQFSLLLVCDDVVATNLRRTLLVVVLKKKSKPPLQNVSSDGSAVLVVSQLNLRLPQTAQPRLGHRQLCPYLMDLTKLLWG